MKGRNRRTGTPEIPYSGGLFKCGICGAAIMGEEIHGRPAVAPRDPYYYYKCRNTEKDGHPNLRWRQEQLESQVVWDLERLRMDAGQAVLFRDALEEGFGDEEGLRRGQRRR